MTSMKPVVDDDLDPDFRMGGEEAVDQGRQDVEHHRPGTFSFSLPRTRVGELAASSKAARVSAKERRDALGERASRVGQPEAARRTLRSGTPS